jgi:hypothetical protein
VLKVLKSSYAGGPAASSLFSARRAPPAAAMRMFAAAVAFALRGSWLSMRQPLSESVRIIPTIQAWPWAVLSFSLV